MTGFTENPTITYSSALFRNSRLFLAGILLPGILSDFICLGAVVLTLGAAAHLLPISADSIYSVLANAFMALSFALMSLWLLKQTRLMAFNHAQLDAAGIEFCYGTKPEPRKLFLPWTEITTIHSWRLPQGQAYRIGTDSGNWVEFSSYTYFRPGKLAALIASRTGRRIERIAK